jgi:hypothetical protein
MSPSDNAITRIRELSQPGEPTREAVPALMAARVPA